MGRLIFILGGARSGKSAFAQELAQERGGKVAFIATAQALDDEMQDRIAAHRQARPAEWQTLEAPRRVAEAMVSAGLVADVFVLDCLTLWINNIAMDEMGSEDNPDETKVKTAVEAEIGAFLKLINPSPQEWIVVSNEVGMGLVPPYPLGRIYRDLLGWANRQVAARASETYLMVAGLPVALHRLARRSINKEN